MLSVNLQEIIEDMETTRAAAQRLLDQARENNGTYPYIQYCLGRLHGIEECLGEIKAAYEGGRLMIQATHPAPGDPDPL